MESGPLACSDLNAASAIHRDISGHSEVFAPDCWLSPTFARNVVPPRQSAQGHVTHVFHQALAATDATFFHVDWRVLWSRRVL